MSFDNFWLVKRYLLELDKVVTYISVYQLCFGEPLTIPFCIVQASVPVLILLPRGR
jgi:hypothetical protein